MLRLPLRHIVALAIITCLVALPDQLAAESTGFWLYSASRAEKKVVALQFEETPEKLSIKSKHELPLAFGAVPLVFHPAHRMLYAAALGQRTRDSYELAAIQVGDHGRLSLVETLTVPRGSGYLSLDHSGKFLLSASYFQGHVDVYRIDEDGVPHTCVHTQYEERDKTHAIRTSPDNRFVYAPLVKEENCLFQYRFDVEKGTLTSLDPSQAKLTTDAGPRHLVFHPRLPIVYFSNEQQLGVTVFRIQSDGQLKRTQTAEPGELRPAPRLAASDISITPDGRFLFVAVRDFGDGKLDAVHRYRVNDQGELMHLGKTETDPIPWGIRVSPSGNHLFVTSTRAGTLKAYRIHDRGDLHAHFELEWGKDFRDFAFSD